MDHPSPTNVVPIRPGDKQPSDSRVVYRSTEFYDLRARLIRSLKRT